MGQKNYRIVNSEDDGKRLCCPDCGENIAPADVESFAACPYCGKTLERTLEFEDFVLDPLVRHWISHTAPNTSRH